MSLIGKGDPTAEIGQFGPTQSVSRASIQQVQEVLDGVWCEEAHQEQQLRLRHPPVRVRGKPITTIPFQMIAGEFR